MRLVGVVLFLHIAVVLIAFGISSVLHTSEWSIASATSVAEIRTLRRTPKRLEPLFPLLIVTLVRPRGMAPTPRLPGIPLERRVGNYLCRCTRSAPPRRRNSPRPPVQAAVPPTRR